MPFHQTTVSRHPGEYQEQAKPISNVLHGAHDLLNTQVLRVLDKPIGNSLQERQEWLDVAERAGDAIDAFQGISERGLRQIVLRIVQAELWTTRNIGEQEYFESHALFRDVRDRFNRSVHSKQRLISALHTLWGKAGILLATGGVDKELNVVQEGIANDTDNCIAFAQLSGLHSLARRLNIGDARSVYGYVVLHNERHQEKVKLKASLLARANQFLDAVQAQHYQQDIGGGHFVAKKGANSRTVYGKRDIAANKELVRRFVYPLLAEQICKVSRFRIDYATWTIDQSCLQAVDEHHLGMQRSGASAGNTEEQRQDHTCSDTTESRHTAQVMPRLVSESSASQLEDEVEDESFDERTEDAVATMATNVEASIGSSDDWLSQHIASQSTSSAARATLSFSSTRQSWSEADYANVMKDIAIEIGLVAVGDRHNQEYMDIVRKVLTFLEELPRHA